ncbi:SirA family protein [Ferroglobus placidus DSM 10642]|uniref:SirA family protein n=1 Tax=Ferroglobus placidus (strain DSM 10642 / AEDII12DO) TaxID=589924 RepID=D3S0V4_FERPA|nr:sulfurtransferase TusA family protein [Ferroglobus placidus]ADC66345.1 SirA family protein [Ferroglobus placidus DSM 10642]
MELKLKKIGKDVYELDVRGNTCPFPQIFTELALKKIGSAKLEVITDNPPSARDLPIVFEKKGYKVESKKEDGYWRIRIWK